MARLATGLMFPSTGVAPVAAPAPPAGNASTLTADQLNALNQAIPGFSGLTAQAATRIQQLMAGQLPTDVQDVIQNARATQAVASGMPGSSRIEGTIQGNATLRDLGITSFQAGQQGHNDLLGMLGAYSGSVAPTVGQNLQQQQMGQQGDQFAQDLAYRVNALNTNAGLDREKLAQQESQFGRSLAQEESSLLANISTRPGAKDAYTEALLRRLGLLPLSGNADQKGYIPRAPTSSGSYI